MKFGLLILRKIIKFVATRCQTSRLKYTNFNFGWSLHRSPDFLAGSKGPNCKGGEGKRWESAGGEERGEGKRGE